MNSEISTAAMLLNHLKALENLTRAYNDKTYTGYPNYVKYKNLCDTNNHGRTVHQKSKERMIELSKLINSGDELNYSISNLYDSLSNEMQVVTNTETIFQVGSVVDAFQLGEVRIAVSNRSIRNYLISSDLERLEIQPNQLKSRRFTPETTSLLEKAFIAQPRPNKKDRDLLAKKTGLSVLQIRVWNEV